MMVQYLTTFSWIHLVTLATLILLTKKGERQEEAPPATGGPQCQVAASELAPVVPLVAGETNWLIPPNRGQ